MAHPSPDSFCFVHAADLHLDTPFRGLREIAPRIAAELQEASLRAFDAIVELTLEREAAFLLVAGDIYDGAERGLRAQLRFREGLARLSDAGIGSFVVHGNHDPVLTGWSAVSSWPERVTIFPHDRVEVVPVEVAGRRIATVQGISYATAATTENLALQLHRPTGEGLHVGLLHCNVQGVSEGHDNYSPCTIADLTATGLDYLALGHIHQRRILRGTPDGGPWIVYPGNSQARSPRRTEQEPKGAVVVSVRGGAVDQVEFVACDRVRFGEVEVAIDDVQDMGELADLLEDAGRGARRMADGRSVVLRARLTGRGPLHRDLSRPTSLDELLRSVRDREPERTPFCWWDAIEDESAIELDLDELRRRGDFAADLLAFADELVAGKGDDGFYEGLVTDAPRAIGETARQLLAADGDQHDLVRRAALLALDQILDEAS